MSTSQIIASIGQNEKTSNTLNMLYELFCGFDSDFPGPVINEINKAIADGEISDLNDLGVLCDT